MMSCWGGIVQIWAPSHIEFVLNMIITRHGRKERELVNPYAILFFGNCISAVLSGYLPEIMGRPVAETLEDVIILKMRNHLSLSEKQYYPRINKKPKKASLLDAAHKGLNEEKKSA